MNPNTSMLIGTIFFLILWLIFSFIIMFKVTKGVNDAHWINFSWCFLYVAYVD